MGEGKMKKIKVCYIMLSIWLPFNICGGIDWIEWIEAGMTTINVCVCVCVFGNGWFSGYK